MEQLASKADVSKYRICPCLIIMFTNMTSSNRPPPPSGTLFLLADPSICDDELAKTLDYRCSRVAIYNDSSYCTNFAAMIEGIIRTIPETTSDVMESASSARRAYVEALPAASADNPREFDESRSALLYQPRFVLLCQVSNISQI
jgi:hypothetical protein